MADLVDLAKQEEPTITALHPSSMAFLNIAHITMLNKEVVVVVVKALSTGNPMSITTTITAAGLVPGKLLKGNRRLSATVSWVGRSPLDFVGEVGYFRLSFFDCLNQKIRTFVVEQQPSTVKGILRIPSSYHAQFSFFHRHSAV